MVEVKKPPPAADDKTVSVEDVNKLKSAYDSKINTLTKQLEKATEDLAAKVAELAEKDVASDDPDVFVAFRKQHVELTKTHNAAVKELNALKAKNEEFTLTSERSRLAKEYEIDEDKITGDTVEEMASSAKDAKIAKLQEDPKAPEKEPHEITKPIGAGDPETDNRPPRAIYAGITREKREAGSK